MVEKKQKKTLTGKQKTYITIGSIAAVAIIILALVLTSSYSPFIPSDDTYDGVMMTRLNAQIRVAGHQRSTYAIPDSGGETSSDTVYRIGYFEAGIKILGGVDQNNQPTDTPPLWNITNPDLLYNALARSPAQMGNSSSNPEGERQGFDEGDDYFGDDYTETKSGLNSGSQLFWDAEEDSRYRTKGGIGLLPDANDIRPFGYVEDAIWKYRTEYAVALPTVSLTFTFMVPGTDSQIFNTTVTVPVAIPLPFDPETAEKQYDDTYNATVVVVTPFKFATSQYLKVSAQGSYISCNIVKGMPRSAGGGSAIGSLITLLWVLASPVLFVIYNLLVQPVTDLIDSIQFWDSWTIGIEHDIDHDTLEYGDPMLYGEEEWVYGGDRANGGVFSGTYSGSDPSWGGTIV